METVQAKKKSLIMCAALRAWTLLDFTFLQSPDSCFQPCRTPARKIFLEANDKQAPETNFSFAMTKAIPVLVHTGSLDAAACNEVFKALLSLH